MDERLKHALGALRSFVSEMPPQQETANHLKAAVGNELAKTMQLLGAKGDLLHIVGSYGDPMDDEELLSQLRAWNAEAAGELSASLPRSQTPAMDGNNLTIEAVEDDGTVRITDGERTADYTSYPEEPLEGKLRIVPAYVEAGWFTEANAVTLTNGARTVVYVPARWPVRYR
jgi:hypothetical protein